MNQANIKGEKTIKRKIGSFCKLLIGKASWPTRLLLLTMLAFLSIVDIDGFARAEIPRIVTWSNSKTGNQDMVFRVVQGETITFSVNASEAEKHHWRLDGEIQAGAETNSFLWTVPDEDGIWKIQAVATNGTQEKDVNDLVEDFETFHGGETIPKVIQNGYYPPWCRKEWIVSTSLHEVKPGESIQDAIDAVPSEGGIIKLASGIHNVGETIVIRNSNIAVQGAPDSEIRNHDYNKDTFHINPDWNGHLIENVTLKNFKVTCSYDYSLAVDKLLIAAANVDKLSIESLHVQGSAAHGLNLNWIWEAKNNVVNKELRIVDNAFEYCTHITSVFCPNSVVAYNSMTNRISGSWGFLLEAGNTDVSIHHNYLENTGANGNIQTESNKAHIFNNVCKGTQAGIWLRGGGPDKVRIENNVVTGATVNGIGLRQQDELKNARIRNNLVYDCPGRGIYGTEYGYGMNPDRQGSAEITNNVIYNCGSDGIAIERASEWTAVYTFHARNNIIANCGGYGMDFDNGSSSYNYFYNNASGDHNSVSPGTGDILADMRPEFIDPSSGDFHLKSTVGRWDPENSNWVTDVEDSPCINAGNPADDYANEPDPNGGRINMGAYGNTAEASKGGGDVTPPSVSSHSPAGNNVETNAVISVTFSESMDNSSAETAFSISPDVAGIFSWNGNKMIFTPDSALVYATAYTITISTDAEDLSGKKLAEPYSWEFTTMEKYTPPPVVTLKTITVNGSVDDETVMEVDINGTTVSVTAGTYSHEVDVTSTSVITIIATNDGDITVTKTINIK